MSNRETRSYTIIVIQIRHERGEKVMQFLKYQEEIIIYY